MSKIIGVIAEDQSDIDTVAAFLEKYVATNEFSVRKFVGNGCGKLRNKCKVWTEMLLKGGCSHVIIFHDLDRHKEPELREMLSEKFLNTKYQASLIVIPIEEMEAWRHGGMVTF